MEALLDGASTALDTGADAASLSDSSTDTSVSTDTSLTAEQTAEGQGAQPKPTGEPGALQGQAQEKMPWDKDPRFIAANQARKDLEARQKEFETTLPALQRLNERGFTTPEHVDELLGIYQARLDLEKTLDEDPKKFFEMYSKAYPKAWEKGWGVIKQEMEPEIRHQTFKSLYDAAVQSGDPNLAKFIQDQYTQAQNGNGPKAQPQADPARQQFEQERQQWQEQKQTDFQDRAASDVQAMLQRKVQPLIEGVKFTSDSQRELFQRLVSQGLEKAEKQNFNFSNQLNALFSPRHGYTSQQIAEIVKAHEAHATPLLTKIVTSALQDLNVTRKAATPGRIEPKGQAGPGAAPQNQRNDRIAEAERKFRAGEIDQVERMKAEMLS